METDLFDKIDNKGKKKKESVDNPAPLPKLEDAPINETENIEEISNIIDDEINKLPKDEVNEEVDYNFIDEVLKDEEGEKVGIDKQDLIIYEIQKLRSCIIDTNENHSKKRKEELDTSIDTRSYFKDIHDLLVGVKKHIGKWFYTVLLMFGVLMFILGGLANENKDIVYPMADKVIKAWDKFGKVESRIGG